MGTNRNGLLFSCIFVLRSLYYEHKTNTKGGVRLCLDLTEQARQAQALVPAGNKDAALALVPVALAEAGPADSGGDSAQAHAGALAVLAPDSVGAGAEMFLLARTETPCWKKNPGSKKN